MTLGLKYMHERSYGHLKFTPENAIMCNPNGTHIWITDFGRCRREYYKQKLQISFDNQSTYDAPEVAKHF